MTPQENNKTWKERFNKKFTDHCNEFVNPWKFTVAVSHEELAKLANDLRLFISTEIYIALDTQRKEKNEKITKYFKELPWGQSGNKDYDRGWDDCKRNDKSSVLTLIGNK